MENGSGGMMGDLVFNGGKYGGLVRLCGKPLLNMTSKVPGLEISSSQCATLLSTMRKVLLFT
jgi:hypothetical protein